MDNYIGYEEIGKLNYNLDQIKNLFSGISPDGESVVPEYPLPITIWIFPDSTIKAFPNEQVMSLQANTTIKYAYVGRGVETVGSRAFYNCDELLLVSLPNTVTSIGNETFSGCTSLTSIIIPKNVTSIGSDSFKYCNSLETVVLGESVTSIGDGAFSYCNGEISIYTQADYSSLTGNNIFASEEGGVTNIYVGPDAVGWTLGADQTISGKSGITVSEWTSYPDLIV
jgi:hypothetical protein